MFKAMCLEESKSDSVSTEKKDLPFSNYPQAFLLSVSIGIVNDERLKVDGDKHWLIRSEYINPYFDVYRQLLRSKYGLASDKEIVETMVEFAESGVRKLFEEFRKTGSIDFAKLSLTYAT
jgi:hypothetical protein